jgi:hypothetical protein
LRIALTGTNTIAFTRISTGEAANYRADWESWEYVGPAGGPNEFIVRSRNTVTMNAGTKHHQLLLILQPVSINVFHSSQVSLLQIQDHNRKV